MQHVLSDHGPCRGYRTYETAACLAMGAEPALDEILADPMVRLVMRRDRLDPDDVRRFMVEQAALLRDGRDGSAEIPVPQA